MYIKFKNGVELNSIESKRGLISVKFQYGVNYVTLKKPVDIIRIDKDERIQLVLQKNIGDLSINQFIIEGKPGYLKINECIPLKIDKLIINESSQIDCTHKSDVNEIIVKEGVRICLFLESVKVVTSYGSLNLNLSKNTIDRDKSHISDETWFNFDIKRDGNGKILFFFDENYESLCHSIFGVDDLFVRRDVSFLLIDRHKSLLDKLKKLFNYPKESLRGFVDGEVIYDYLIKKYEVDLEKSKKSLLDLREEITGLV